LAAIVITAFTFTKGLVVAACFIGSFLAHGDKRHADKSGELQFYSDVIAVSPVIAVDKFDSNWATAGLGNYAQAKSRVGVKYPINNTWSLGVEQRLDYLLHFSKHTAAFYKKLENNGLPAGTYPLWLSVNAVASKGLFVQYFIPLSKGVSFNIKSHVLKPSQVQYGQLSGVGNVAADESFDYYYNLDYSYDHNELVNGNNHAVTGWGHSFDLQLSVNLENGWRMQADWQDVLHRVYWAAINHDNGCLAKTASLSDANCFVKHSRIKQTQKLSVSSDFQLEKTFKTGFSIYGRLSQWSRYDSALIGVKHSGANIGLDILNRAIHLAYESDMVRLKLASDQFDVSHSKYLQVSLDINWPIL
jgi:hypothetical protein